MYSFVLISAFAVIGFLREQSKENHEALARSRQLLGNAQYFEALQVLDTALALNPDNQELMGEFRKDSELYVVHEISDGYQQVGQNPHDVGAYVRIANALLLAGKHFEALEILTEATFDNQTSPIIWKEIAKLESIAGRSQEANSALRQAERYESID